MDYKKLYSAVIENGAERQGYTESHHIIPKCRGGTDESNNLVSLTAREHYIAHWILTKIYPNDSKLFHAFSMMSVVSHGQERFYTSRQFARCAEARAKAMSITNPSKTKEGRERLSRLMKKRIADGLLNPGKSAKSRQVARDRMLNNNPNQGGATNPRAKAIEVLYEDGTVVHYDYGKQFSELTEISYPTVKALIRHGTGSPKYKIKSITQRNNNGD